MASCRKRGSMIFTNSDGSMTSRISSNSFRNMTSFGLWVFGQYLRSAITTYRRENTGVTACSPVQGSPLRSHRWGGAFSPVRRTVIQWLRTWAFIISVQGVSRSAVTDSLQPYGLVPTRLLCPWDSPGKNIGIGGYHALLQGIFLTQGLNPGLLHGRQILYNLSQ